jgi:prepilin-type processing-associated H-X9-DG protein
MPTGRHGQSYALAFADGHLEIVKRTAPVSAWVSATVPDPDWLQLKRWSTVPK